MPVVVVGLNHKTAPVGLLERLSISEEMLPKALHHLATYEHVFEGAVLSTCNRIEVYANVSKFHGGAQDLRNFLAEFCHVAPEDFADHLYTYHDDGAVRHLFRVAAGIDSMVVGESEILGQVRRAFQFATQEGMVQRTLGHVFRQSLRVGKRARAETSIGRNPVSVSSAAVELASRAFSGKRLDGKRILIVGVGKMGRLAMKALARAGATDVTLVNRSAERAEELAAQFDARSRPFEELVDALSTSDIVISSTTAPQTVIDKALVVEAMASREPGSPLFIVDIAVPRDVDPAVAELEGVEVRDVDDLRAVVETSIGGRLGEVSKIEEIIAKEVDYFLDWERATEIAPTVSTLVARAEAIRKSELDRLHSLTASLSEDQRRAVEQLTKRIVAKLLHSPVNRAKELSSSKQGQLYLSALHELFQLDDEQPHD